MKIYNIQYETLKAMTKFFLKNSFKVKIIITFQN